MSAAFILRMSALGLIAVAGCAGPPAVGPYPNQQRMVGQTKTAVLACAGAPTTEQADDAATLLLYYREAPMLEESVPVGKSSFPRFRHGCWATVVIRDGRVTDVRYRFAPAGIDASNDCEEIFAACPR